LLGFFVCKLKKLSNDKNVGAVVDEEDEEDEFEVNEGDFKNHVLEDVQIPKAERRKKGRGKKEEGETAPALVEVSGADDAPKKTEKVKKPSKIYLEAMAELEAERKAAKDSGGGDRKKADKKSSEKKAAKTKTKDNKKKPKAKR